MKKYLFNTILLILIAATLKAQTPVAAFSGSRTSGCAPLSVAFRDESTGNPRFWDWEFTGPGMSQLDNRQNPTVTFSQPGLYKVTLVVRNANGANAVTKEDYIEVFPSPTVSFSANITTACLPAPIQFTSNASTSVGTISSLLWEFGDGTTSTVASPTHTYSDVGYYTVMLTATSSNNCSTRRAVSRYIRMVGGIEADFLVPPSAECNPPFTVNLRNESSGPGDLTYEWNLGNGNTSTTQHPTTIYPNSTPYTVSLITRSSFGCADTVTKQVQVTSYTTDFNVADTVCIGQDINLQNTSGADVVAFRWDFGDGTSSADANPSKSFSTPGQYTVKLVNYFGNCSDSLIKTVRVMPKPVVDFTTNVGSSCALPFAVQFQNNTPGTTVQSWDFGDGLTSTDPSPTHSYAAYGNYSVSLTTTTSYGCEVSGTKANIVRIATPRVSISTNVNNGCAPLIVTPTANIVSVDPVTSYQWDLGNGTTSTSATPSVTYNTPGNYVINLVITTQSGCQESATYTIRVGSQPAAVDFTFDAGGDCIRDSSSFFANAPGTNEWLWDFGDGTTSTLQNPKHVFRDTGIVSVSLIAFNNGCASAPVTKTDLFRKKPPIANFGIRRDCDNLRLVYLTDSSKVDADLPFVYTWDFGDGTTSNAVQPGNHQYVADGRYVVRLRVDNGDCWHEYQRVINIAPLDGSFTMSRDAVCREDSVTFTANELEEYVSSYRWNVNNDAVATGKSVTMAFSDLGDYNISLQVTGRYGCTESTGQVLKVTGPQAGFEVSSQAACVNGSIQFTDLSVSDVGIESWTWDFGDGTIQTLSSNVGVSHQYSDTGRYVVKLLVRDRAGCTNEFTLPQTINIATAQAAFTIPYKYCPGLELPFNNTSKGDGLTYSWDFGDGTQSSDMSPMHIYSEGTYTVKLTVEDIVGCRDSVTKADLQIVGPVADFDIIGSSSICEVLESRFPFKAQNYESVLWDFGNGSTSTRDSTGRAFYPDYGTYTVTLYAYGFGGCVDTATGTVNVYDPVANTQINYTLPATTICNEITVDFDVVVPPNTRFVFNFGDGASDSSGSTRLTHTYSYPRSYSPSVSLVDSTDCRTTVTKGPRIEIYGAVPVFNLNRRAFCDSGSVNIDNFTVRRDNVVSYAWNFGDGFTSAEKDPLQHKYTQPGLYPVNLTVTTERGCVSSFTDTVRVPRTPQPSIQSEDLTCVNRMAVFNGLLAQPDTAIRWSWNFGDGRTSAEISNNITFDRTGTYNIQLAAANSLGCIGTASKTFTVAPLPVITTQDVTIPVKGQIQLPVTYSPGVATYHWAPSDGLSCINCPNPIANPDLTTTYNVVVTDSNTCVSSADIRVNVVCSQENFFVPNTFSPNGDGSNDVFYPRGRGLARVHSMKIFNRWGQMVFDRRNFMANDPSAGWNGRVEGQPVPPDVYVYVVEFVCDNAQIIPFKGNVTLIR